MSKTTNEKELLKQVYKKGLTFQLSWSYERMQGLGFAVALSPVLEHVYKDRPEEYKAALKRHLDFFNTSTNWGGYPILGIAAALEMEEAPGQAVQALKTSLMGPLAGIGDTINFAILLPILFSIPASMAIAGNSSTAIIALIAIEVIMIIAVLIAKWKLLNFGYNQGTKLASQSFDVINKFTFGAGVLGLTVVGAMISSMLNINTPVSFLLDFEGAPLTFWTQAIPEGANAVVIQNILNQFIPKLLPIVVVSGVYYLFKKKEWSPVKIIWVLMLIMFVLGALRIIG